MRLWSLHPSILDRAALVAGWREGLLAQAVLAGRTRGYTRHPQLTRFRRHDAPLDAIGVYLGALQEEAGERGYRFDRTRILHDPPAATPARIPVTSGQLSYELAHLRAKVAARAPAWEERLPGPGSTPPAHPALRVVPGDVEDWEVR